jgi:GAF domain-containing protein
MLGGRSSEVGSYTLIVAVLIISGLFIMASGMHWHAYPITFGDIAYFALLYLALAALSFPVLGSLRAGIEGTAVLAAFFSLGLSGALWVVALGHLSYEVLSALWQRRSQQMRQSLRQFLTQSALNIALLSFSITLAAQVYAALNGRFPLSAVEPAYFVECLVALFAYTVAAIGLQIGLAYWLSKPAERQRLNWRKLRFVPVQALAHVLALLVTVLYINGTLFSNLLAFSLLLIAALIARSTERDYLALIRRVEALATLNTIGQALSRNLTVSDLAENLYTQVRRVMDASIFYVALYDPRTQQISFPLSVHRGERRDWQPVPLRGITGYIIKTGRSFLLRGTLEETNAQLRKLGIERFGEPSRCFLGVPMIADGAVLGVLAVQSLTDIYAYDCDDQAILEIIAAQAATALQNIQLYEDLFGIANKLALLNEVSSQMISNFDLESLLESACRALQSVGNAKSAAIFLFDPESQTFNLQHASNLSPVAQTRFSSACEACLYSFLQHGAPTIIQNITQLPAGSPCHAYAAWAGCEGLLAFSLSFEGQSLGVAIAHYSAPFNADQSTLSLLTAFTNQLATSLANARHHADIEQRAQELTQLVEASRAFTASLDLPRIAERLFDDLERLLAPSALLVQRLLPDGALEHIASRATGALFPIEERLMPLGTMAQALQSQQTHCLPQSAEDSILLERYGFVQALVIPIVNDGQTFGVVSIFHAQPTPISGRAQQLAEALVNQAALALRNAQAYQQVDTALEARVD